MQVEYVELSNAEQREEAIRSIVTAQQEERAAFDERIDSGHQLGDTAWIDLATAATDRRDVACEWLALVA